MGGGEGSLMHDNIIDNDSSGSSSSSSVASPWRRRGVQCYQRIDGKLMHLLCPCLSPAT